RDEGGIEAPRRPLCISRDARRLSVRLIDDAGEHVLLLEERPERLEPEALLPLGLSRREAEVLVWVAQGKTNADVAQILGARPATVAQHLKHVFRKLGVETRTAAAVRALEAAGPAAGRWAEARVS